MPKFISDARISHHQWRKQLSNKHIRLRRLTYIHTCRSYLHMPHNFTNSVSLAWRLRQRISTVTFKCGGAHTGRLVRFWSSGEAKFTKIGDSLPWTPMNRRAKCEATSFILSGENRNRTNKQANKKTHQQTATDISTPCPSACVNKKQWITDMVSVQLPDPRLQWQSTWVQYYNWHKQ